MRNVFYGFMLLVVGMLCTPATVVAHNANPAVTVLAESASHHVFLPLVQSNATATVSAADSDGSIQSGVNPVLKAIEFGGYYWHVLGFQNYADNSKWENVWMDSNGNLHLKISHEGGNVWSCAGVVSGQDFGFGQYQWEISGRLDQLDPNVVLMLGTSVTAGIEINFARWGVSGNPVGNYNVKRTTHPFPVPNMERASSSIHRFTWQPQKVLFQSLSAYANLSQNEFANWTFDSLNPLQNIPQQPLPIHMKLCLFNGNPPTNGQPVEVVIRQFQFTDVPASLVPRAN